ncbi:putative lipid II flippase MurJ [Clostridium tetani]|uniref:murein biosynthesis integral membrane protein MurJ n=1 Tax=Clostridium tetani TaxID=1513 RepID=UPI00100B7D5A|nr:murein biosynthesis integral membrane protein MurJ [Clostridium tetani]RXI39238.1 murein biosynthesis integral membrane protein MurJ [Clostridium tetani]BDR68000.1 putative lipid II flippase MurJ [Clostridium tetani]BDR70613.1 putative lipid II flippase MurJ [Clostridium tetani]BDR73479.1 putative lipid II flippase MurJ [Clostridium tetani]BEV20251.1 murein biosynthesis integral membrane protein MurJ [Clostridium tetani]
MADKKVIKSSLFVMVLIILGKVFALFRDSLIAAKFGATYITDIYNFALGVVYLLTTISYGLTTTFIPLHTENIAQNKNDRDKFVNNVLNVSTIVTIIITIVMIILSKDIIHIFAHGFQKDPQVFDMAVKVTRIMLLSLVFVSLQSVITGVLQSHNEFLEPASMAMVSNIVYIIYLVFLTNKYGIVGFAFATVIAFFAQFIINVPKYKKLGYNYSAYVDLKDNKLISLFKLMIPVIISTSVIQLNSFVNRSFATNIYFGAVTVLDCANKINTLAYEVFAIGIAMIVYPTLSQLGNKEDKKEYKIALNKSINMILLIMVPAAFGIAILREPLINIIFKRGAFTDEAAKLTSQALLLYTPAMIAYGIRDILNKAFYAIKDTKTPMINSFIGIIINIVINIILIKTMQVRGLTLATTISAIIITLLMLVKLNKKLKGINLTNIFISFIKITLASIIMGLVVIPVNNICLYKFGNFTKGSLISLLISTILGGVVYLISVYLLKIPEVEYIINNVLDKLKVHKK